jgi:hypothetical protein
MFGSPSGVVRVMPAVIEVRDHIFVSTLRIENAIVQSFECSLFSEQ